VLIAGWDFLKSTLYNIIVTNGERSSNIFACSIVPISEGSNVRVCPTAAGKPVGLLSLTTGRQEDSARLRCPEREL
jgi:hypothetical protein